MHICDSTRSQLRPPQRYTTCGLLLPHMHLPCHDGAAVTVAVAAGSQTAAAARQLPSSVSAGCLSVWGLACNRRGSRCTWQHVCHRPPHQYCEKDGQGRRWEGVREAMGGAGGELLHSSNGIRIGGAFKLNDNICLFDELPLSAICINQPIISYTYV